MAGWLFDVVEWNPMKKLSDDLAFAMVDIASEMFAARPAEGLTQEKPARAMKTTQSAIARLEGGSFATSISSMVRMAQALKRRWLFALVPNDRRFDSTDTVTHYGFSNLA